MKKLLILLAATLLGTTGMAIDYGNTVHWSGTGDWMADTGNWTETPGNGDDWNIPGWVVGNPANTNNSTDLDWNKGAATVDSGTLNLTPSSRPDGSVDVVHVGTDGGQAAILNVSGDLVVAGTWYMGYKTAAGTTGIVNQTAGAVVTRSSIRWGNDDGHSIYNLSGGTLSMEGSYDSIGYGGGASFEFNQTGGSVTVVGTRLNIGYAAGSTSVVNLEDGIFDASALSTWVGTKGSGTFNQSGGSASFKYISLAADTNATPSGTYSISGGDLSITGYVTGPSQNGVFEVDGSGATSINVRAMYLAGGDTFRVKLDKGGSTLVNVTLTDVVNSFQLNDGSTFEVDTLPDFDGTPGRVYDIVFSRGGFYTNDMVFSDLSDMANFSWGLVSTNGGEMLQLTVVSVDAPYDMWSASYNLTGGTTGDDDGDGLENLYEFGLGGDPTNPADRGISPTYEMVEDAGTWLDYVYPKRSVENSGLLYYLELSDDLVYGAWTNSGYAVTGTGSIDSEFDAVTNRIPTDANSGQFVRLVIEQN